LKSLEKTLKLNLKDLWLSKIFSMKKLPAKIKNLYLLQELDVQVPFFIVVDSVDYKSITQKIEKIKEIFKNKKVKSVIIRSASFNEDLDDKSMAGFFESSKEILLNDLDVEKIKYFWNKNKKKAEENKLGDFFIFIQEFFRSDYSGVLFTEDPYDENGSIIILSSSDHAITDGLSADKKIIYNKKEDNWDEGEFLGKEVLSELKKVILKSKKSFNNGADIEFGIKNKKIKFYQIRPITRNKDEKLLLKEKKRLKNKFGTEFEEQTLGKNGFVEALGDLTPLSLSFYNYLLNSIELKKLLKEARAIDEISDKNFSLLENVGGRTYFNFSQEKNIFLRKDNWWNNFKRTVLFLSQEKIMKKKCLEEMKEKSNLEEIFAWFFISGIYLQFFLEQEKRKYKKDKFIERLKNTERICGAKEPRPKSLNDDDLAEFVKEYYYLANFPYEFSSKRLIDIDLNELKEKYSHFRKTKKNEKDKKYLNKKIQFWLRNKVLWKNNFLKLLIKHKNYLVEKYGEEIFQAKNWKEIIKGKEPQLVKLEKEKISNNYLEVSGENYPFAKTDKKREDVVVVPGITDFNNLTYFIEGDNIEKYFGKYLAVNIFSSDWIPYISEFKGIVLKEGNELSHMAITCREYNIPCIIKSDIFKKN